MTPSQEGFLTTQEFVIRLLKQRPKDADPELFEIVARNTPRDDLAHTWYTAQGFEKALRTSTRAVLEGVGADRVIRWFDAEGRQTMSVARAGEWGEGLLGGWVSWMRSRGSEPEVEDLS